MSEVSVLIDHRWHQWASLFWVSLPFWALSASIIQMSVEAVNVDSSFLSLMPPSFQCVFLGILLHLFPSCTVHWMPSFQFMVWDEVWLSSPGWPRTHHDSSSCPQNHCPDAPTSHIPGLQTRVTMSSEFKCLLWCWASSLFVCCFSLMFEQETSIGYCFWFIHVC